MITKTHDYLSKHGIPYKISWQEEEGFTEKIVTVILDDIGDEGETREATRVFIDKALELDPTLILMNQDELASMAGSWSSGYESCRASRPTA